MCRRGFTAAAVISILYFLLINEWLTWLAMWFFLLILLLMIAEFWADIKVRKKKERILRATLNATNEGILVVDNEGKIVEVNDILLDEWGVPKELYCTWNEEQLINHIKRQLVDPDFFVRWVRYMSNALTTESYRIDFNDGRVYDIYTSPIIEKGCPSGRMWSCRNITAQISTENKLLKSEEKYRTLIELCPDAIYVIVDNRITFSNIAGAKILGLENPKELWGWDIKSLISEEFHSEFEKTRRDIFTMGRTKESINMKLIRQDGNYIDVEVSAAIFSYDGKAASLCIARDISERKKAEELKKTIEDNIKLLNDAIEYDKIKTEFFANVSHEIKTPLNIILGSLQLIELIPKELNRNDRDCKLNKYIHIMKQNCFRLLRLFNNLFYITEIDSGFVDLHLRNYNLAEIIEDITLSVAEFVKDKGISIDYESEVDELITACDMEKIEKIVLNLLSNAIKFTKAGDRIKVLLHKENSKICISVKDNGIGIPEDKRDIIFQRFRQVDKSFTRNCEGSGIGLSMVKSLVAMHGGTIDVVSEQGKGSEFIVKLPICIVDEEEWMTAMEETALSREERINIEFSDIYF
jgi:PAS domain S-box-containing protein